MNLRRTLAVFTAVALLGGCSGDKKAAAPTSPGATTAAVQNVTDSDKPLFEVSGDGADLALTFAGDAPTELQRHIAAPKPDGHEVGADDIVFANYHGQVWDGDVFDSSFTRGAPVAFNLNEVIPGWKQGLTGTHVGERVQLSIPSELGYPQGTPDGKIKPGDSIVFVVDVIDSVGPDAAAPSNATEVKDPAELGLTVTEDDGKVSGVSIAEGTAVPTELTVEDLKQGSSEVTAAEGDTLILRSAFAAWPDDSGQTQPPVQGAQLFPVPVENLPQLAGKAEGTRFAFLAPAEEQRPAAVNVADIVKIFKAP